MLGVVVASLALLIFCLTWHLEADLDLGFHLAGGRLILAHGWPDKDSFTYTVSDQPYVDTTGGFQIAVALAQRFGGDVGLALLRLAFVFGATGLVWAAARRRGVRDPLLVALFGGLAVLAWETRFATRPESFTYVYLCGFVYLLRRHHEDGRRGWLIALVPLQLLWSWTHALALLGPLTVGLYALCGLASARRRDWTPWAALGGTVVALALNPYGWRGLALMWLLRTRLSRANVFGETITELASPFTLARSSLPIVAFEVFFVVALLVILLRVRRLPLFDVALAGAFAYLAATSMRNMPLFVIAALPPALESAEALCRGRLASLGSRVRVAATMSATAVLLFLASQVVLGGYYMNDFRALRFGCGWADGALPLRTTARIERDGFAGPIFNDLNYGGYLIGRLWPRERVFIDGRLELIGEDFYQRFRRVMTGAGWAEMVQHYQPRIALVPHNDVPLLDVIRKDPQWALVDLDGVAALFLRRTPENAAAIAVAETEWAQLDRPAAAGEAVPVPRPRASALARHFGPRAFPWETRGRGTALLRLGLTQAARREFARALDEAGRDEPTLAFEYASACDKLGRRDEAQRWMATLPRQGEW